MLCERELLNCQLQQTKTRKKRKVTKLSDPPTTFDRKKKPFDFSCDCGATALDEKRPKEEKTTILIGSDLMECQTIRSANTWKVLGDHSFPFHTCDIFQIYFIFIFSFFFVGKPLCAQATVLPTNQDSNSGLWVNHGLCKPQFAPLMCKK